jgi:predicted ATP-grasp superfamily ATP-dependent carboligase
MDRLLLVVGASARAAAGSVLRAGWQPLTVDLFADADLQAMCRAVRVAHYPAEVAAAARELPDAPWMYTGALENHRRVLAALARRRRLYGNPVEVVRRARDPWCWSAAVQRWHLPVPELSRHGGRLPRDGTWLCKSRRGSGGSHVRPWIDDEPARRGTYFQRRVAGLPCGATYVAASGDAVLLGACEQLCGTPWLGGEGFQYCGSIGPLRLEPRVAQRLARLGRCLAAELGLVGLFGVDVVLSGDGWPYPVEINPRYTASVEVLEQALDVAAVAWHVAACMRGQLPDAQVPREPHTPGVAKGILYARRPVTIDVRLAEHLLEASAAGPVRLADIPPAGSQIAPGRPILSVIAQAQQPGDAVAMLREAAGCWESRLYGSA